MFLYGPEAITYLNAILWVVREPAVWVIALPRSPTTGSPPPLCMAALPSTIWKRTCVWLNYHTYFKKQRGNLYGSGPSYVKQLSPIHMSKIGLTHLEVLLAWKCSFSCVMGSVRMTCRFFLPPGHTAVTAGAAVVLLENGCYFHSCTHTYCCKDWHV